MLLVLACLCAQAFIDGTTFSLGRSDAEEQEQTRHRLGPFVWRMSTGADGLFSDNVGPSLYAASRGKPVSMWGVPGQRPVVLSHLASRYGREDREHDQRTVPIHAAPERAALGPQLLGAGRSRGSTRARP